MKVLKVKMTEFIQKCIEKGLAYECDSYIVFDWNNCVVRYPSII